MKKILIPILVFSLYSCSTTEHLQNIEDREKSKCNLIEDILGYHVHSGTYVNDKGQTITWRFTQDNNDECYYCISSDKENFFR